jgi:hypothetical protein
MHWRTALNDAIPGLNQVQSVGLQPGDGVLPRLFAFAELKRTLWQGEQHMENLDKVKKLAPDLRREEPRSSSEELAGESHAARALDKCRATLAGCAGEFTFGCAMDRHFFAETGIDMGAFKDFVATGADDREVEGWIRQHVRSSGKRLA